MKLDASELAVAEPDTKGDYGEGVVFVDGSLFGEGEVIGDAGAPCLATPASAGEDRLGGRGLSFGCLVIRWLWSLPVSLANGGAKLCSRYQRQNDGRRASRRPRVDQCSRAEPGNGRGGAVIQNL
jgi:hypothetical protein